MTIKPFLKNIVQILDELKIEYAVSGGIAVSVWGNPRYTADLDIVIEISSREKIEALIEALLKKFEAGYLDKQTALTAYQDKGEFNLIEPEYGLKADFFVSENSEYAKGAMARRKGKKIGSKLIKFFSPEDLIISKLRWYQISQSDRQLEDILTVLEGGNIDKRYLSLWIKKLGLEKEYLELKNKNPRG